MRSPVILVLLLSCVACKAEERRSESSEIDSKPQPATPELSATPSLLGQSHRSVMTDHFAKASALEQAVIDGDLEAVHTHAKWLVEALPADALPQTWQPQLARMQAAASEAARAEDLPQAASAAGKVIESCGACHAALETGPRLTPAPPMPEGEDSQARMQRHQWAAERMREGMIGPSDDRWQLGASAVSVAPPQPCPIESAEILPADVLALREKIYEIGARAAATTTARSPGRETSPAEDRARVYGEYLSTCAGCHVGGC